MSEYIPEIVCPYCGYYIYEEPYADEGCYHCVHTDKNTLTNCDWVGVYCKTCNKLLREKDFGLRGDVYECKECGRPQWGYTEFMRKNRNHVPKENTFHTRNNFAAELRAALSSPKNYLDQYKDNPDQFDENTLAGLIGRYMKDKE